ncbi:MAG TPA: glycosyltransferase family A protein [Vicinamibacterales bacterium]|nr:glycosyltransferase family A protein [Vicinamibacterales bacterium]
MTISVVIPACQAAAHLPRVLDALAASTMRPLEIIVVDDGSTDGTPEIARAAGARVVPTPNGPSGPARARNLGASLASGDLLVFLDADVAVHPETLARFHQVLAEHPDVAAVFGSYDAKPAHPGIVSQYRNLLHHFVHQQGRREASTFWAGCGAIRREVFEKVGGFDERYRRPSIEDIELGGRLRARGYRVWLRPEIQAIHLKHWTFAQTVRSDIRDRAIPWTRLILQQGRLPSDLNTGMRSRLSAAAAWLAVTMLPAGALWFPALVIAAAGAAAVVLLNAKLYGFFLRQRGFTFAAAGASLHTLYLLYSSAVFAGIAAGARIRGQLPAPDCQVPE